MEHNAFVQFRRWNVHGGMRGGMQDDAVDAAPEQQEHQEQQGHETPAPAWTPEPPPEFWTYNAQQLQMPPAPTAYPKYCDDWREWTGFRPPEGEEEYIPPGIEYAWHERFPDDNTYENGKWYLTNRGIKVHTQVDLSFVGGHADPLLVIKTDQQPDWTASDFISHRTSNSLMHRHVTVGYMQQIMDNVPGWNAKLERLYQRFHDRDLWLWGHRVSSGATLELTRGVDPIASDDIVQEFHATYTKPFYPGTHEAGHPHYEDYRNWVQREPDIHISL